jgi:hypothetical protein
MHNFHQSEIMTAMQKGRALRSRQFRLFATTIWNALLLKEATKPDLSLRHNRGANLCKG